MKQRRSSKLNVKNCTLVSDVYNYYFNEKKSENLKYNTLNTYKMHLDYFLSNCELNNEQVGSIDKNMYNKIVDILQHDNTKNERTIATYCRSIKAFIYWLQDNEYIDSFTLKIPKYQKNIKKCYNDEELTILLTKPDLNCTEVFYQTWVYENFICATGLRLSSSLDVTVNDISFSENCVYVNRTKNNNAIVLYLNNDILKILKKYILLFDLDNNDYLFCTARKTRLKDGSMKSNVRRYNMQHGITKTSIHLFRHTFAKNYYKRTKDIYSLSKILDHSSISVTEDYLRDLGCDMIVNNDYNPQQEFATVNNKTKRRGRLK